MTDLLPSLNAPNLDANTASAIERYVRASCELAASPDKAKYAGFVNVKWFGAKGDGVTNDSAAFVAAIAYLKSIAPNQLGVYYSGSPRLYVPAGTYIMGTTTLDITHHLIIEGDSSISGYGSVLKWTGDATAIRIQAYNTTGETTTTAGPNSGSYTVLRNLGIRGPYWDGTTFVGHTEGEYHGVRVRSNIIIEDCEIAGFAGDGVNAVTASGGGGAIEGNSNCSFINRLKVGAVRNGVYLDSADANAWTIIGVIGLYCRQWTVWDSSFLGNTHIGHHSANAGLVPGVAASVVSQGGNRYAVIAGQETGASTNAPSGTTADNTWWLYLQAGGADATLNIPAWSSGATYRAGGCYHTDSANGYSTFLGCYQEGGEGPAQFVSPTLYVGGLWGGNRYPITTGNAIRGNALECPNGVILGATTLTGKLTTKASSTSAAGVNLPHGTAPTSPTNGDVWTTTAGYFVRINGATVSFSGSNTGDQTITLTSDVTGSGTGSFAATIANGAVSLAKMANLAASSLIGNATGSAAAPAALTLAGGLGFSGSTVTINGAVTAATSVAIAGAITSSSATAGIGYATGAGGTVTQTTGKTNSVTLNKACGEVTMNNAALASGNVATFTLTSSAFAAGDNLILNHVATGTFGAYMLNARCGAGFANIDVRNVSAGSLSEAIVIRFTLVKGVTA